MRRFFVLRVLLTGQALFFLLVFRFLTRALAFFLFLRTPLTTAIAVKRPVVPIPTAAVDTIGLPLMKSVTGAVILSNEVRIAVFALGKSVEKCL